MTDNLISFPAQKPTIPTLDSVAAAYEQRITEAYSDPASEAGSELFDYIAHMMGYACDANSPATFESLFEFVAIARGLHAGANAIRPTKPEVANDMASLGQLFLDYAVEDIGNLMSGTAREALGLH
jgi:hypothetical protein